MIAARCAMLLFAAVPILAAFGATDPDLQPSALRVLVTAVVGALAPLFWPGGASTLTRTALRIAGWSAGAACVAAVSLRVFSSTTQPPTRIASACAVLMVILIVAHAMAAMLEERWHALSTDAASARDMAGRAVAVALVLLGSLPLWLGPAGELLSGPHPWVIDTVLGISPLTHLAVGSGNDLLRNQWLYQHSNLAALPFSYPGLGGIVGSYAAVVLVLALATLTLRHSRRATGSATSIDPHPENTPS